MDSFTAGTISVVPPVGSIISYMGKTIPSGWIRCDGKPIINSNNIYKSLIDLGIGTSNTTTYTPPNLLGRFLRGTTNINSVNSTAGSSSVTLSESNMPSHNHTITATQDAHSHVFNQLGLYVNTWWSGGGGDWFGRGNYYTSSAQPAITATASYTGGGAAFTIRPKYVTVIYLLKY
jgi:microcystin-dependent protein